MTDSMVKSKATRIRLTVQERAALEVAAASYDGNVSEAIRLAIWSAYIAPDGRLDLLRTIQMQDAEIQRLKAELYKVTP